MLQLQEIKCGQGPSQADSSWHGVIWLSAHKVSASKPWWLYDLLGTISGPSSHLNCAWELFGSTSVCPIPAPACFASLLTGRAPGQVALLATLEFFHIEAAFLWEGWSTHTERRSCLGFPCCSLLRWLSLLSRLSRCLTACVSPCKPDFSLQPSPPSFIPPPFFTGSLSC